MQPADEVGGDYYDIIHEGDTMLLYADGIVEAKGADGNLFSEQRLAGILRKNGEKSTNDIKNVILDHLIAYECLDDVTMVVLKRI